VIGPFTYQALPMRVVCGAGSVAKLPDDMSLHHKLCQTLGGTLDLPHAQTHTVVLPHALAYNGPSAPGAVAAWPAGWAPPRSLSERGMREGEIPRIVELAVANPYANPRPVTPDGIESPLRAAWVGDPPAALHGREDESHDLDGPGVRRDGRGRPGMQGPTTPPHRSADGQVAGGPRNRYRRRRCRP
jgi:hypothetical protein